MFNGSGGLCVCVCFFIVVVREEENLGRKHTQNTTKEKNVSFFVLFHVLCFMFYVWQSKRCFYFIPLNSRIKEPVLLQRNFLFWF